MKLEHIGDEEEELGKGQVGRKLFSEISFQVCIRLSVEQKSRETSKYEKQIGCDGRNIRPLNRSYQNRWRNKFSTKSPP